jgi:uncharacterized Zn-finger protein
LFGFILADVDVKEEWILRPSKPEVRSVLCETAVKSVDELSSFEFEKCLSAQVLISQNIDIGCIKSKHHNKHKITKKQQNVCDICGAKFTQRFTLNRRKLIHSGEKPHKCYICRAKFTESGKLNIHKLIHSGERPHECYICGVKFTQLGHLKTHKLIHSGEKPHGCDICGAKFTRSGTLKRHKLIHSGEKTHGCDICGAKFTQLGTLRLHKLVHSGENHMVVTFVERSLLEVAI